VPFTFNETLSVTRKEAGSYSNTTGNYTAGASTIFSITASVQPASGKQLERIPENRRERDAKAIYTRTKLKNNDFITIDSNVYEVDNVRDYSRHPFLAHYEVLVTRKKDEGQRI